MYEDILSKCESFIEESSKDDLYNSLKDYCDELGFFKGAETDEDINNILIKKFNILFDDENEINEESLKNSIIDLIYSNNKKDNDILFNCLNYENDEDDTLDGDDDFDDEDDDE